MLKYLIDTISRAIGFTKTESRGALLLIFIILIGLLLTNWRISSIKKEVPIVADSTAFKWMDEVQASIEVREESKTAFDKSVYFPTKKTFEEKKPNNAYKSSKSDKKEEVKLEIKDLNKATAKELQMVKGIGPTYSERIIKYRNLLGGFADTTQLREVYGLKAVTIKELSKHFQIITDVNSIEINTDSLKVLARHPYINYDLARIILNYRQQHGDFKSSEELRKIKAIDEGTFLRLKPYLD